MKVKKGHAKKGSDSALDDEIDALLGDARVKPAKATPKKKPAPASSEDSSSAPPSPKASASASASSSSSEVDDASVEASEPEESSSVEPPKRDPKRKPARKLAKEESSSSSSSSEDEDKPAAKPQRAKSKKKSKELSENEEKFFALSRTDKKDEESALEEFCSKSDNHCVASDKFDLNFRTYRKALKAISSEKIEGIFGWSLKSFNENTEVYASTIRYLLDPRLVTLFNKGKFSAKHEQKVTPTGANPLHLAAFYADTATMEALIQTGLYKMSDVDDNGFKPMHYLALAGTAADYVRALQLGGDSYERAYLGQIASKKNPGYSPIEVALKAGNTEFVGAFLATYGVNLRSANDNSLNLYLYGVAHGPRETVEFVLDLVRGPQAKYGAKGRTVLMAAATSANIIGKEKVEDKDSDESSDEKADKKKKKSKKDKKMKNVYALDLVLGMDDVDVLATDNDGRNAFELAAEAGKVEMVKKLYQADANSYNEKRMEAVTVTDTTTSRWIIGNCTSSTRAKDKHRERNIGYYEKEGWAVPELGTKEFKDKLNKAKTKVEQRSLLKKHFAAVLKDHVDNVIKSIQKYDWNKMEDHNAVVGGALSAFFYVWNFGHNHTELARDTVKKLKEKAVKIKDPTEKLEKVTEILAEALEKRGAKIADGKYGYTAKIKGGSFNRRLNTPLCLNSDLQKEYDDLNDSIENGKKPEGKKPAAPAPKNGKKGKAEAEESADNSSQEEASAEEVKKGKKDHKPLKSPGRHGHFAKKPDHHHHKKKAHVSEEEASADQSEEVIHKRK